jgi:hypothetical protein
MIIYIKNTDSIDHAYEGQIITPSSYYLIEYNELEKWQNSSTLLSDIGSGKAVVAKSNSGTEDITDVATAINYLKENEILEVKQLPFAVKVIDGKNLFKRIHGAGMSIAANSQGVIDFVIPYNNSKITGVELIGGAAGDTANFEVYDTPTGTLSGYPNVKLNQFAFGVYLAPDFYAHKSEYDSDLVKDLKIKVTLNNSTNAARYYGVNFILNELKT